MITLSKETEIPRSIPTRISSYSASLLEARKSKRMACSIISPIGALSCSPSPASVCHEAPSTFRIHQPKLSNFLIVEEISTKKSASMCLFNAKRG